VLALLNRPQFLKILENYEFHLAGDKELSSKQNFTISGNSRY
jgi:hypothetical protein